MSTDNRNSLSLPRPECSPIRLHGRLSFARVLTTVLLATWIVVPRLHADALSLIYRGTFSLPGSTNDQFGASFDIDGLSGITWAGGSTFWAVMDNSDKLVRIDVSFDANGIVSSATVAGGLTLPMSRDFEGIAFTDVGRNSVFLSDETMPGMGLREFGLAGGSLLQSVSVPPIYGHIRSNYGLESLTRRPDGQTVWTANEEALTVDGSLSSTTNGSVVRMQQFVVNGLELTPTRQVAYLTEPVHRSTNDDPTQINALSRSGLVELVALPDGRMLSLERSFARADFIVPDAGSQYRNSIFLLDLDSATDVSVFTSGLVGESYEPAGKSLLWQATHGVFTSNPIGNLEGLSLGPQLPNGNHVLLGIVDWPGAGSSDTISANRLVAFELVGTIPEPATFLLLAMGAALPLVIRRRRSLRE